MYGLDQTADIYTPHATTGDYTVLAKSGLVCRLAYISRHVGQTTSGERVEIAQARRLLWEEAYTMPENAQIDVGGERWNVRPGTLGSLRGPDSSVIYRRCEVVEAGS